jgi:hypothetical protein
MANATSIGGVHPLRISFGLLGVLTKYPNRMSTFIDHLVEGGAQVYIITDLPLPIAKKMIRKNDISIPEERVISVSFIEDGDRCVAKAIEKYQIDLHIDANAAYCDTKKAITMFVWPNAKLSVINPEFRVDGFKWHT